MLSLPSPARVWVAAWAKVTCGGVDAALLRPGARQHEQRADRAHRDRVTAERQPETGQIGDENPDRAPARLGTEPGHHGLAAFDAVHGHAPRGQRYRQPSSTEAEFQDAAAARGLCQGVDGRLGGEPGPVDAVVYRGVPVPVLMWRLLVFHHPASLACAARERGIYVAHGRRSTVTSCP